MRHITITGSLGSGKSVASKLLKCKLGLEILPIGDKLREMAQDHGMSTSEFNKYMETHPEIDHKLDDFVKEQGSSVVPKIFDSRLAWHFVPQSLKVYLFVKDEIAASRVYNDKKRKNEIYTSIEATLANIIERRNSEVLRYKTQYNIDLEDLRHYNLIIDTSYSTEEEISDRIIQAYKNPKIENEVWFSPYTLLPTKGIRKHSISEVGEIEPFFTCIEDYQKNPVQIISKGNDYYIYDGHKRVLNAVKKGFSLIPCVLLNYNPDCKLAFGQTVIDYINDNVLDETIPDWLDLRDYIKPQ